MKIYCLFIHSNDFIGILLNWRSYFNFWDNFAVKLKKKLRIIPKSIFLFLKKIDLDL